MDENYYLCIFQTKNKAMQIHYHLEEKGFDFFRLVTAPCGLNAGCNYAIRFKSKEYLDIIINELRELEIDLPTVYYVKKNYGGYRYIKTSIFN